jgi:hypothetical protein
MENANIDAPASHAIYNCQLRDGTGETERVNALIN